MADVKTINTQTTKPTQKPSLLIDVLTMSHLVNGIGSACGVTIGFLVTAWYHGITVQLVPLALAALSTLCISNGGFIVNDILDREIDRINRPDRPIAAGRISVGLAWICYGGYTLIGLVLGLLVSPLIGLLTAATALGLLLYSSMLKKRFLIGHLTIALLGATLFPFGGLAAGYLIPVVYTVPVTLLAFFAREVLKTVPDAEGDAANKVVNLTTRYGQQAALRLATALLLLALIILPLVQFLWPLNIGFTLTVVLVIWPISFRAAYRAIRDPNVQIRGLLSLSKLLFLLVAVAILVGSIH